MSCPLAIFTPHIGAVSETFIRRHIELLLPGGTVAFTGGRAANSFWSVQVPLLELGGLRPGLARRGIGALRRSLGGSPADHSRAAVQRFLRRHGVRVIMGEYLDLSLEWLDLAQDLGLRFFAHAHGYDVSRRLRDPKWRAAYAKYNEADGVITVSRLIRDRLIGLGLTPSRCHVVPYGVDVPAAPAARPERKVARCLAVGRLVGKKAPIVLLDAFRRALEIHPDLRLDVVGSGVLLPAAQQFVRAFDLQSSVTLHGSQLNDVVQQMMRDADVFLQHSMTDPTDGDEEGLPVAILEAMAQGLPIVSTRHAGIPEAVDEGVTGYLVEEGDSVGMAERLACLARDPQRTRTMGNAGWARAKERFSWSVEQARLLEILGLGAGSVPTGSRNGKRRRLLKFINAGDDSG